MNFKDYDIAELKGVGPAMREKLARLGIENWQDFVSPATSLRRSHPVTAHRPTGTGRSGSGIGDRRAQ